MTRANQTPQPALTAAAVAWNSADVLADCLEALRASATAAGIDLELIVVDNGSTDDSMRVARRAGARVVVNPLNAGFGVAASQALALAQAPLVLLVNPDVVVAPGFVDAVLDAAAELPAHVATFVPDLRFRENPQRVNSRGIAVDDVGIPMEREAGETAMPVLAPIEVFGGSSGGCVLRMSALHRVGGLETAFFAYLEDVDLAWRLNRHGYRAVLVPGAVGEHEGSASVGEGSWLKSFLVARNRRLLFKLHGPRTARSWAWRLLTEAGHGLWAAAAGAGTAPVRGRLDALRLRRYVRFVRASRRAAGDRDDVHVALVSRATLRATVRKKRTVRTLMRRV